MVNSNLILIMKYKKRNDKLWVDVNISIDDYFDLEEDEVPMVHSVPNYNHVIDYIEEPLTEIEYTFLKIVDLKTKDFFEVRETFWNDGKNCFIEVNSNEDNTPCTEFIVNIKRQNADQIIRIRKDDEFNKLLFDAMEP